MRLLSWLALLGAYAMAQPPNPHVRVLLDTDAFNEIDDQFFLAYSLLQPAFDVEGITAVQYHWEQGSVDESYYEILRIMELLGLHPSFPVVRGSDVAMRDATSPLRSEATELIGRLALKSDPRPLYVVATGALTNVASALLLHPEIKPRIRVIWLGGFPPDGKMDEFNASNDRAAVKTVFESGVDLTVVPTETSARYLTLPYREAERRLSHTNLIGNTLLGLLRDYGERQNKVIWDISTAAYLRQIITGEKFFEVIREPAASVDLTAQRYIRDKGPHIITVLGKPDRDRVFADFFRGIPAPHDSDAPYLLSAFASEDLRRVDVLFSKPMDTESAVNPSCYQVDGGVAAAALAGDRGVRLTLSRAARPGATITVTCARDLAGNGMLSSRAAAPIGGDASLQPGMRLAIYKVPSGLSSIVPAEGPPIYEGVVKTLDWPSDALPPLAQPNDSAKLLVATGNIYLPLDHRYELVLLSRGLSRVFLDGELLLDQSRAGNRRASSTLILEAGIHAFRVEHYADRGHLGLTFEWNLPFHEISLVPENVLFHKAP